jgi:hypothetical protein
MAVTVAVLANTDAVDAWAAAYALLEVVGS